MVFTLVEVEEAYEVVKSISLELDSENAVVLVNITADIANVEKVAYSEILNFNAELGSNVNKIFCESAEIRAFYNLLIYTFNDETVFFRESACTRRITAFPPFPSSRRTDVFLA